MKLIAYMLPILIITGVAVQVGHAESTAQSQVLQSYISYLKTGDTAGILSVLGNPLLSRQKELLESNPSYSDFLIAHYQGSDIIIASIQNVDAYTSKANIEVVYQGDDNTRNIQLLLKNTNGRWTICDELQ
jgi:hypothetical protein